MTSQEIEKEAIENTYISLVSQIFDNFIGAYTAANSSDQQASVKATFQEKIAHIRLMKDIAISSLPA